MAKRRTARPEAEGGTREPSSPAAPAKPRKRTRTTSRASARSVNADGSPDAPSVSDTFATGAHGHNGSGRQGTGRPTEEEIRVRAYYRYLERGRLDGGAFDDWILAEQELSSTDREPKQSS
jgi:hypothetical protein